MLKIWRSNILPNYRLSSNIIEMNFQTWFEHFSIIRRLKMKHFPDRKLENKHYFLCRRSVKVSCKLAFGSFPFVIIIVAIIIVAPELKHRAQTTFTVISKGGTSTKGCLSAVCSSVGNSRRILLIMQSN